MWDMSPLNVLLFSDDITRMSAIYSRGHFKTLKYLSKDIMLHQDGSWQLAELYVISPWRLALCHVGVASRCAGYQNTCSLLNKQVASRKLFVIIGHTGFVVQCSRVLISWNSVTTADTCSSKYVVIRWS